MRVILAVALLVTLALPAQAGSFRTEERLGTALSAGPVQYVLDPGAPAGDANPRLLLPGTTSVRAEAVVLDSAGHGVPGVKVYALVSEQGKSPVGAELSTISPGVYRSAAIPWGGARVTLLVLYDWNGDGSIDRSVAHTYRPAA